MTCVTEPSPRRVWSLHPQAGPLLKQILATGTQNAEAPSPSHLGTLSASPDRRTSTWPAPRLVTSFGEATESTELGADPYLRLLRLNQFCGMSSRVVESISVSY